MVSTPLARSSCPRSTSPRRSRHPLGRLRRPARHLVSRRLCRTSSSIIRGLGRTKVQTFQTVSGLTETPTSSLRARVGTIYRAHRLSRMCVLGSAPSSRKGCTVLRDRARSCSRRHDYYDTWNPVPLLVAVMTTVHSRCYLSSSLCTVRIGTILGNIRSLTH